MVPVLISNLTLNLLQKIISLDDTYGLSWPSLWHLLSFAWRVTLLVPSNIFSWLALHQPTIKAFHLWCFKSWPTKIRQRRTRCFIVATATSSNRKRERPGEMLFSTFCADVNLKIILSFQLKLLSFYSLFCNLL